MFFRLFELDESPVFDPCKARTNTNAHALVIDFWNLECAIVWKRLTWSRTGRAAWRFL